MRPASEVRSLDFQAGCLRHVIASARYCSPEIIAGAEQALKTLEWLAARQVHLKALVELDRVFPGSEIIVRGGHER